MWPSPAVMANCRRWKVNWRARWAGAWPRSRIASRPRTARGTAREARNGAVAHGLAVGRGGAEPARVGDGRLSVADLHPRGPAVAGAVERSQARSPPHLRLGHLVRHPLSCVCDYGVAGQPCRALGGRNEPAAGVRLVLHYDSVPACFSSASRMNGMVSRRWAANEASSRLIRNLYNERKERRHMLEHEYDYI